MRDEHMRQIEEKIFRERQRMEEEAVFADLWYQDIQAKKDKEDRDVREKAEKNRQVSSVLREQMLVLEKQKEEQKQLKMENAKLLVNISNNFCPKKKKLLTGIFEQIKKKFFFRENVKLKD